ncbi:MAG: hypothetical protein JWM87_3978, partial [Candidatus Eremiobacteraeota bacterium]|nr:hypothetical protein [Candidatus Eremiobacteraeota bacterium]
KILPDSLLSIFDGVMFEETRHVVFFINWWRYEQARAGRDNFLTRTATALGYHGRAALGTITGATDLPPMPELDDPDLKEIVAGITPLMFIETALAENRRMMARLDHRLIKPTVMPAIATALLLGIRMLPPRKDVMKSPALAPVAQDAETVRSRNAA